MTTVRNSYEPLRLTSGFACDTALLANSSSGPVGACTRVSSVQECQQSASRRRDAYSSPKNTECVSMRLIQAGARTACTYRPADLLAQSLTRQMPVCNGRRVDRSSSSRGASVVAARDRASRGYISGTVTTSPPAVQAAEARRCAAPECVHMDLPLRNATVGRGKEDMSSLYVQPAPDSCSNCYRWFDGGFCVTH
ncbi:hypothetical protein FKP32DRAFT_1148551 [Trametes sanguinea]|nr:hypothetical protein FKP32DRAFT_1148551 [Trametes sanguinea]